MMRIEAHAAMVHLRKDSQQLTTDVLARAERRVIATDTTNLIESRRQLARLSGTHQVDVTV